MNTPADKPDLPALFPARIASFQVDSTMRTHELSTYDETDMRTYGRMCADEREAWARADERRKARAELIAERDAAFNRGMFVAAGIAITAYDLPTVAGEIIQAAGPEAVKDADEYDAGVLAPHFPQFAPYAPKE